MNGYDARCDLSTLSKKGPIPNRSALSLEFSRACSPPNLCRSMAWIVLTLMLCTASMVQGSDDFSPPPTGDPSAFTFPLIGDEFAIDALRDAPGVYRGALEGGPTGTAADVGIKNVISERDETSENIPSGGLPSPLFGAESFTQQMLLFEEIAVRPYSTVSQHGGIPFPLPGNAESGPEETALDAFLAQPGLRPLPTRYSNTVDQNPWTVSYTHLTLPTIYSV